MNNLNKLYNKENENTNDKLNKVYQMDNLELLQQLDDNSIDLIYCDILFNTGRKFKDYDDNLGSPQEAIQWYEPRLMEMKRILSDTGSIYIQCDAFLVHYLKVKMDEIFGYKNFQNQITWKRGSQKSHAISFGRVSDYILFYTKSNVYTWNKQYEELSDEYIKSFKKDERGKYTTSPLHSGKPAKNVPEWRGIKPPEGRGWAYKIETLEKLDEECKIEWSRNGTPRMKRYLDEISGSVVQDIWTDIKPVMAKSKNHYGYDSQKPEELLERIIKASSNEGDVIADFFCGSGTSLVVAKKLGRQWLGCDISEKAIHITKERLNNK